MPMSKLTGDDDPAEATYEVLRQEAARAEPAPIDLPTPSSPSPRGSARLPDMKGLPMREAVRVMVELGLIPSIEGTGELSRQDPPAGAVLPKGASVKLVFEPPT
jgi:cell division protein FtsI (penicillin-binding protein 3)